MSDWNGRFDLGPGPRAARTARAIVRLVLTEWGFTNEDWLHNAALVTSELVTNAVRHGGGRLRLDLRARQGEVVIGATDGSAARPRRRDPAGLAESGRGVGIIEALGCTWGVDAAHDTKRVWARLPSLTGRRRDRPSIANVCARTATGTP